jgi:hypothetical protein
VENEDPEGTFYLNLFNLNNKITEDMILDFYSDVPAESVLWNKSNYFSADVKFQTYESFKKAVLLGEPTFNEHKACIRTSFQNIDKQQYLNRREEYFNRKKGGPQQKSSAGDSRQWRNYNGYPRDPRKNEGGYQQNSFKPYNRRANESQSQYYTNDKDYNANSYQYHSSAMKDHNSNYGMSRNAHYQNSYPTHNDEGRNRKGKGLTQNRAEFQYSDEQPQSQPFDKPDYEQGFPYDYSQEHPAHSKQAYSYVVEDYQSFKVDPEKKPPQQAAYQYTYDYNNPQNQDWENENQDMHVWGKKTYEDYPSKSHTPYDAPVYDQAAWANNLQPSSHQQPPQYSYQKPKKSSRHEPSGTTI